MYTIGEFSRITSVTVKALRHYHSKGIVEPSYVNKDTGYRYYREGDIDKLRAVTALKLMGFELAEIKDILANVNDESDLTSILSEKNKDIAEKINRLKQASSSIELILTKEKEASKMLTNTGEIVIKELEELCVIATKWSGAYKDTGKAMGKVYKAAGRHANGPALNLYFDNEYKEITEIETCLPVKKKIESRCEYKCLEGGAYATIVHVGSYETLSVSYAKLFEFINMNNKQSSVPIREVYHKGPGMLLKGNPKKYVTEIQIPVT